ncbi:MAG: FtsW/RodA/SpoVE family cell cycle protein [Defluviitaleaceae bacterium]|nr:FtsW/RodA/SpoVE family cell cycle protein [Defluviitaleaceae bacterium]
MTRKDAILQGLKSFDYLLALTVIAVSVFGIVMIYTSANHSGMPVAQQLAFGGLWRLQQVHVISGTVLMLIFACIDYRLIGRLYLIIYGVLMALLLALFIMGPDPATNTARWLPIPIPGLGVLSLQPSEFAKIFMIIFLAKFLEVKKDSYNKILWLGLVLFSIAVPVFFVATQPSLSAALVITFASLVVLFTAGLKWRYIIIGVAIVVPILVFFWLDLQREEPILLYRIFAEYQVTRIRTNLYPIPGSDEWRQIEESRRAIAAGGLTGRGFMDNQIYLIFAHNDLIFSVVAEQFGFVGSGILLGAILIMVVKCILIALRAIDMQGKLIAAGVAGMLIFETFVHVGVVTGLLPATGMPFPFMSYGGSMIWVHMIAMGMVLNIGLKREVDELDEDLL